MKLLHKIAAILLMGMLLAADPADPGDWSPGPWLKDLAQARKAFSTKYANIDWLENDRQISLDALFDETTGDLRAAHSDADAERLFDRLVRRIGDGHVSIEWPHYAPSNVKMGVSTQPVRQICGDTGFDEKINRPGVAAALPGYRAIDGSLIPAGLITTGGQRIGVLRIGYFGIENSPPLCGAALVALQRSPDVPCDDPCSDDIRTWSYNRLTGALEEQVRQLRSMGATILLVDITNNGGGTEWAEAAARILSAKVLESERMGFVRGSHWSAQWAVLTDQLRQAAIQGPAADRKQLLAWAQEADRARVDAERTCRSTAKCELLGHAGYATGLVGSAAAGQFSGKPWADLIFNIAQYPYHDGVWSGPLLVLVDDETWSAAEEFAATLQDNGAAVIIGTRTGGAGCGYTGEGTPTILKNSQATLKLPDCVRFRANGSNEVSGIIPDVLTGVKAKDGQPLKARLTLAQLDRAIEMALLQNANTK